MRDADYGTVPAGAVGQCLAADPLNPRQRQPSAGRFLRTNFRTSGSCFRSNSFLMKGFCPFAESPDTQARLFADLLFRLTDAKFPAQVADVAAAYHPPARIQIFLLHAFCSKSLRNMPSTRRASSRARLVLRMLSLSDLAGVGRIFALIRPFFLSG